MFSALLNAVKLQPDNDPIASKRRYPRRDTDKCVALINGQIHPVENWSVGGVLINTDSRPFAVDNEIDITLKFKLRDRMIDIPHRARVIRKNKDNVAFEFLAINDDTRNNFQMVIEDFVTAQFAESQR